MRLCKLQGRPRELCGMDALSGSFDVLVLVFVDPLHALTFAAVSRVDWKPRWSRILDGVKSDKAESQQTQNLKGTCKGRARYLWTASLRVWPVLPFTPFDAAPLLRPRRWLYYPPVREPLPCRRAQSWYSSSILLRS